MFDIIKIKYEKINVIKKQKLKITQNLIFYQKDIDTVTKVSMSPCWLQCNIILML